MKKLLAVFLALITVFSIAGCAENQSSASGASATPFINATATPTINVENIEDFEDFVEEFDKTVDTEKTENEDGTIIIDMIVPGVDDEDEGSDGETPVVTAPIPTLKPTPSPQITSSPTAIVTAKPTTTAAPTATVKPTAKVTSSVSQTPTATPTVKPTATPTVKPTVAPTPTATPASNTFYTYTTGQKHTALHYTKRHLYSVLDDEMKGWYKQIDEAVTSLSAKATIAADLSVNERYYIYYLYMFDNPEHFYLANSMTLSRSGNSTSIILSYSTGDLYCKYGTSRPQIDDTLRASIIAKKKIFDDEVNRIISTIPANAPDVQKERLIYDRILIDSYYNLNAKWDGLAEDNWTAYGIIINKYGVCESYSEAFQLLCLKVGILATGIIGTANGDHKWNAVMLDNEWYICDITFDDPIGGEDGAAYHYYFNKTTEEMKAMNHDSSNSRWPVPVATATKYSYNNYFKGN